MDTATHATPKLVQLQDGAARSPRPPKTLDDVHGFLVESVEGGRSEGERR